MDESSTALIVALVREATDKVVQAESRLSQRLDKLEGVQLTSVEKQTELNDAISNLDGHVKLLQDQVKKVTKTLGIHKKKGLFALLVALFSGAAIASGSINYQTIIEKLLGIFKNGN